MIVFSIPKRNNYNKYRLLIINLIKLIWGLGFTVFFGLAGSNFTAQSMSHQLMTVADTQNRNAQFEYSRINVWGSFQIHRVRAAGKDDTDRIFFFDGFYCCLSPRNDLAVDTHVAYTTGDQLVVLAAEVQNQYDFVGHKNHRLSFIFLCFAVWIAHSIFYER